MSDNLTWPTDSPKEENLKKSQYITDTDTEGEVRAEVLGMRSQTYSRFQEAITYINILK